MVLATPYANTMVFMVFAYGVCTTTPYANIMHMVFAYGIKARFLSINALNQVCPISAWHRGFSPIFFVLPIVIFSDLQTKFCTVGLARFSA